MGYKRERMKGRKISGPFFALPRHILDSKAFTGLSHTARTLLLDLCAQYRGNNNGDLCATWKLMKARNWRSKDTLNKALRELLNTGFIECTRQGGRHRASLYALTWLPIDECNGKLDVAPSRVASNRWKKTQVRLSGQSDPSAGAKKGR